MKMAALLVAGCAQTNGPHLTSVTPAQAAHGQALALAGERLCEGDCMQAAGELTIGNVRAPLQMLTDASAELVVPDAVPAGKTTIVLTVNDTASNALAFEVLP